MISRTVECLWSRLNAKWLRDRSLSYVDPRRATYERVYEQAIERMMPCWYVILIQMQRNRTFGNRRVLNIAKSEISFEQISLIAWLLTAAGEDANGLRRSSPPCTGE